MAEPPRNREKPHQRKSAVIPWVVIGCVAMSVIAAPVLLTWIVMSPSPKDVCPISDCEFGTIEVLRDARSALESWSHWAFAAKLYACILGGSIATISVVVASKKLDDTAHFVSAGAVAGLTFVYALLQPYEEYRQFRAASAEVELAYLTYMATPTPDALLKLVNAKQKSRELLKESWEVKNPGSDKPG